MNLDFWRDKRILLTGHTGFKGSWLSLWLQALGCRVTGFALPPDTNPSLYELAGIAQGMTSIIGDIRDADAIHRALQASQPELVIHMAAQPLVRYGYHNPVETYATNVMGTVHLLEAVRQVQGIRGVLVITSDKCYDNPEQQQHFVEDDRLGGKDPYSSSKACTELVVDAYRASYFPENRYQQHGLALATARAGNVIGGGDWSPDRLVPDTLAAFSRHEAVTLRYPEATRPWQHVLEPLHGYLLLMEKLHDDGPAASGAWNFGPDDTHARTVVDVVEKIAMLWPEPAAWRTDLAPTLHEARYLGLNHQKAREQLGWIPQLGWDETLEWVVDWHQQWMKHPSDIRKFSCQQIQSYQEKKASDE
ncbi:MAG: hypothetical protein RIQ52_1279 [Pseudomonadota bacterium]